MYCNNCGSLIKDGQSFCANCGAPVQVQQPQPVVQPQPAAQPQPAIQPQPAAQPQPVYQQPVVSNPAPEKKSKGAAIASLILGIFTLSLSWVIFLNALSILSGIPGTILSIVAITKKNGRLKPMAVAGLILGLIGMIFSILTWVSMWVPEVGKILEPIYDYLY